MSSKNWMRNVMNNRIWIGEGNERGEERWETREEGGVKEVGMNTLGRDEDCKE